MGTLYQVRGKVVVSGGLGRLKRGEERRGRWRAWEGLVLNVEKGEGFTTAHGKCLETWRINVCLFAFYDVL
jgi:hypothetical protein